MAAKYCSQEATEKWLLKIWRHPHIKQSHSIYKNPRVHYQNQQNRQDQSLFLRHSLSFIKPSLFFPSFYPPLLSLLLHTLSPLLSLSLYLSVIFNI